MQGCGDGSPHLVLVSHHHGQIFDFYIFVRVGQYAVDQHGLDNHPADIVPILHGDLFALFQRFFRIGDCQISQRIAVAAAAAGYLLRDPGGSVGCHVEREQPHNTDEEAQQRIFEPVPDVEKPIHAGSFSEN